MLQELRMCSVPWNTTQALHWLCTSAELMAYSSEASLPMRLHSIPEDYFQINSCRSPITSHKGKSTSTQTMQVCSIPENQITSCQSHTQPKRAKNQNEASEFFNCVLDSLLSLFSKQLPHFSLKHLILVWTASVFKN